MYIYIYIYIYVCIHIHTCCRRESDLRVELPNALRSFLHHEVLHSLVQLVPHAPARDAAAIGGSPRRARSLRGPRSWVPTAHRGQDATLCSIINKIPPRQNCIDRARPDQTARQKRPWST